MVTLNSTTPSYPYTYGEGRLVVIDPATDTVTQSLALTGLKNCEGLDYLPAAKVVLVACAGSFDSPDQALESGIAVVDVATTPIKLTADHLGAGVRRRSGDLPLGARRPVRRRARTAPSRRRSARSRRRRPIGLQMFDFVSGTTTSIATVDAVRSGPPGAWAAGGSWSPTRRSRSRASTSSTSPARRRRRARSSPIRSTTCPPGRSRRIERGGKGARPAVGAGRPRRRAAGGGLRAPARRPRGAGRRARLRRQRGRARPVSQVAARA